ncbi:MAG: radical SAM protein [Anaerolineaceae bacterium]|nr:MAG: radical SAM protein [Anaerolineaceae bacterium]
MKSENSVFKYIMQELQFIKSHHDFVNFYRKITFVLPRKTVFFRRETLTPPCLQIEPTNYCNVRCSCCSAPYSKRPKGFMDLKLFQRIVDSATLANVQRIYLYLHGEPLLHPGIIEMIQYIKEKGLAVNVTTNGMRLDSEKIEAILSAKVNYMDYFTFSIFGSSSEIHEKIMRGANLEKIKKNILNFVELRQKRKNNGPIIETIFHSLPDNKPERSKYLNFWEGKVDHVKLCDKVSTSFSEYKSGGTVIPPRTRTCNVLWERLTVFWNGDATICAEDIDGDWILGNLKDKNISEIWNCQELLSLRKIHREKRFGDFPFCSSCDL